MKKNRFVPVFLCVIITFFFTNSVNAQYASKKVLKKKQAYTDSIKQVDYHYIFPFLGQKVYKKGFDIPYPIGLMGNYIWLDQGIVIDNMQLGLETENVDIPLTNVDEFIEFGENTNTSYAVNIRPDVWVLPFLNIYGIFGFGNSTTYIELVDPISFKTKVDQSLQTSGFGVMGAGGVGPVWISIDANWTWNKPELLDKPVLVRGLGIRLGKTFTFNQHPDRNIAIWAGGMRIKMESSTVGQIRLEDALPPDVWERRDEFVARYEEWYNSLPGPIRDRVDQSPLPDIVDRIDEADGDAIAQFQLNKRWMFRTEWGLIGDRKSALASINYRFLL
jgi:hypothetical protein